MYEIFGIEMNIWGYAILFLVCQFINVALNTIKTIIMHKEEKISSAIINAITYGFYTIIVVMTASELPLWLTIVITIITNLIGVYISMLILEKLKKDSLWEIVATIQNTEMDNYKQFLNMVLSREQISFNCVETNKQGEYVYHIYSENQKQSAIIKKALSGTNAKYIVHEEKVRL